MCDNFVIDEDRMTEMLLGNFEIFVTQYSEYKSGSSSWIAKISSLKIGMICKNILIKGTRM